MNRFSIFDSRFWIGAADLLWRGRLLPARAPLKRPSRCDHDSSEFARFSTEQFAHLRWDETPLGSNFEPVYGLVRLFFHDGEFGDHLGRRSGTARGPVVGLDGRGAPSDLGRNASSRPRIRDRVYQFQYAKGKGFSAVPEFSFGHGDSRTPVTLGANVHGPRNCG